MLIPVIEVIAIILAGAALLTLFGVVLSLGQHYERDGAGGRFQEEKKLTARWFETAIKQPRV